MGVSVEGGKGRGKSMGVDLNLVPFIDFLSCLIAFLMTVTSFCGASRARASSRGSSILADSRSAYRPAISTNFGSASGISFRWI